MMLILTKIFSKFGPRKDINDKDPAIPQDPYAENLIENIHTAPNWKLVQAMLACKNCGTTNNVFAEELNRRRMKQKGVTA